MHHVLPLWLGFQVLHGLFVQVMVREVEHLDFALFQNQRTGTFEACERPFRFGTGWFDKRA